MKRLAFQMLLRRVVLACYLGAVAAAVASPIFFPLQVTMICSAAHGDRYILLTDDGTVVADGSHLDCPLCLASGVPAPAPLVLASPSAPMGPVVFSAAQSAPTRRVLGAPLPARGPPRLG